MKIKGLLQGANIQAPQDTEDADQDETRFVYDTGLLYAYIPITRGSYGTYEEIVHHDYEMHIFHQRDQKWRKITNPRVVHDLLASYDSENISAITAQIILEKQLKES